MKKSWKIGLAVVLILAFSISTALAQRIDAPQHVSEVCYSKTGKITVTIDADVYVPDVDRIPIYSAELRFFEIDELLAFADVAFGDREYFGDTEFQYEFMSAEDGSTFNVEFYKIYMETPPVPDAKDEHDKYYLDAGNMRNLDQVNRQVANVFFALLIVLIAIGLIMMVSGITFIDSIVQPIRQINEVTKRIAGGDMSARMEPQEYHDEISELSENINFMADELSSTDKMKNDFISTVSHEMKTPLTAIKGWAETLQTVGDSDPTLTKRGMEVIIDEATRLTGVVEDLLDLSKIVNGRMTLRYEKIDILAELDDTIFVFKDRSMREGIELIYNVPHVPAPAEGDPNRINQVFVNILDNAFKYTEQGGKITVFAEMLPPEGEEQKSTLRVFVEDTGCGISKEELPKVRKKFYKSNISVRGSGIGLAVVDEIVKMHGGTMDIQSEVGVGTCVILSFPVDTVPVEPVSVEELASMEELTEVPEVETETTEVE